LNLKNNNICSKIPRVQRTDGLSCFEPISGLDIALTPGLEGGVFDKLSLLFL
jgi:hypothetical protein